MAGLTAMVALLGSIIAWETTGSAALPPDAPDEGSIELGSQAIAPKAPIPDIDHGELVKTIFARPLFAATRRPPEPLVASVAEKRIPPPRLTGLILTSTTRQAIFATSDERGRSTVRGEGGRLGAFTILEIAPGHVKLLGPDGAEHNVSFSEDPASRAAGAALAAAAQIAIADAASARSRVLDVLRTIPGDAARLGLPGGPVPRQAPR